MKVLLVTPDYPLQPNRVVGGVEGVCSYLVQALRQLPGIEVEVLLASPRLTGDNASGTVEVDGTRVHRVGRRPGWTFYGNVLWAIPRAVLRQIAAADCDIVHVQGMERIAARLRRSGVLTIHGINELDSRFRGPRWLRPWRAAGAGLLARQARRQLRCVIAINPFVRNFLGERSRVWEIPNPVPDSFFSVERQPETGRVFAAARLSTLKNIAGLIRGFALLPAHHSQTQLRIAGTGGGAHEAECRALVRELGLTDRVKFLGALSVSEVQAELSRASCLVLTSLHENAPLVISEAHAAGVPVVASRVGGIAHMIEEGVTGRLIDPRDPADIARGLDQLLSADDRTVMGAAARAYAERSYRASVVARRTVKVYREILGWPELVTVLPRRTQAEPELAPLVAP